MASRFAVLAMANVTREYPNKLDHVMTDVADVKPPRVLHPLFYGSFDWHSCVHGYWLLARIHRRFPELPESAAIARVIEEHFTAANAAAEAAYIGKPASRTFERPYGLAWLAMLAAELSRRAGSAERRWFEALSPLASVCAARLNDYFAAARYPVRAGTHTNSAFALALALEYADACGDDGTALRQKARLWFGRDVGCPAWEPDGEDFLSPALTEALCMSRALAADEFSAWLAGFLPRLAAREPAVLFEPATVGDRSDPKFVHLDGLNLSRAWCWRNLAGGMDPDDPRRAAALAAAASHLAMSLPHIGDDYAGSHWLATFAMLALDA